MGLSLGSADPLNSDYLARLQALADRIEPVHVSDHLAWVSVGGTYLNDLAPLPSTEAAHSYVAERIVRVQDPLGRRTLIENLIPYLQFSGSDLSDWQFLRELVIRADCHLLLDVNNVHVNATNHGFDPLDDLDALPIDRVKEIDSMDRL